MQVDCGTYQVVFNQWDALTEIIRANDYSKIFVLVDENTKEHCLGILETALNKFHLDIIEIESGEKNKNIETCQFIWNELMTLGADRQSVLLNLGGGVIGDMGGFCASSFMRGIDFIQIPTTLLSMTDASVGGKLGIDFNQIKNAIGLFNTPQLVLIEDTFLDSLPFGELRSGYAENLKHGLIADKSFWDNIKEVDLKQKQPWSELIFRSVQIKQSIVAQDIRESGIRKVLNFGHSIGHALESYFLSQSVPILHGEAVATGMICEAFISRQKGMLSNEDFQEIVHFVLDDFPVIKKEWEVNEIFGFLKNDKKNNKDQMLFSLVDEIGHCVFDVPIQASMVMEALDYYSLYDQ